MVFFLVVKRSKNFSTASPHRIKQISYMVAAELLSVGPFLFDLINQKWTRPRELFHIFNSFYPGGCRCRVPASRWGTSALGVWGPWNCRAKSILCSWLVEDCLSPYDKVRREFRRQSRILNLFFSALFHRPQQFCFFCSQKKLILLLLPKEK